MNWIKGILTQLNKVDKVNNNIPRYWLAFSVRPYDGINSEEYKEQVIMAKEQGLEPPIAPDCEYLQVVYDGIPAVALLPSILEKLQSDYDKSDEVNYFNFNGEKAWFDKNMRLGLVRDVEIAKSNAQATYRLWVNNNDYLVTVNYLEQFLKDLEVYAVAVNNATQQHIKEIRQLSGKEEVLAYRVDTNYPSAITFDMSKIVTE